MKRNFLTTHLVALAIAITATFVTPGAKAQTALFIYDDGSGVPNAGTYFPGSSFTFSTSLAFVPGGSIQNLQAISYWFRQSSPAVAPFPFSITLRDVTGSQFTNLQTPGLTYPQTLNPSNANDLGASSSMAVGAGTYFIANLTFSIANNAPIGTYVLSNTTSGAMTSSIFDSSGHGFAIPEADYTVTVISAPDTGSTLGLLALALAALFGASRFRALRLA